MIDLITAKRHLRIDSDEEDTLIQNYLHAATAYTEAVLGRSLCNTSNLNVREYAAIQTAILLMLASLYENRELYVSQPIYENRAYMNLLMPYRQISI